MFFQNIFIFFKQIIEFFKGKFFLKEIYWIFLWEFDSYEDKIFENFFRKHSKNVEKLHIIFCSSGPILTEPERNREQPKWPELNGTGTGTGMGTALESREPSSRKFWTRRLCEFERFCPIPQTWRFLTIFGNDFSPWILLLEKKVKAFLESTLLVP